MCLLLSPGSSHHVSVEQMEQRAPCSLALSVPCSTTSCPHVGFVPMDVNTSLFITEAPSSLRVQSLSSAVMLFSCSVMSDSLRRHGLQNTRLPCPSPTPGAYSNSCPLMPSSHLILSSPSPPAFSLSQGSFLMSQFFASGGQSIRASVSASVLPMNIQA